MTTSRARFLAAFLMVAGMLGAQAHPKELSWAVSELSGGGEWAVRLPQLLVRGWDVLPDHAVTEEERAVLRSRFLDETLRNYQQQSSRLALELDRKRLSGTLPTGEPATTAKALDDLEAKSERVRQGDLTGAEPPTTMPLRVVWAPGRDKLPWSWEPRHDLVTRSKAMYLLTGSIRTVGSYLSVSLELYSSLENRTLSTWQARFAPEEASDQMALAAYEFRTSLLGRPWSGLSVTSSVRGAKVRVLERWHNLPWSSDDFFPGTLDLLVQNPGREDELRTVALEPGKRTTLSLGSTTASVNSIVLDTVPTGVPLYIDSRYLGPSPQTVDRPLTTSRVRAQAPEWATMAWEIGPETPSPSVRTLLAPRVLPSIADGKDRFYASLAAFSFSLTGTAFLGAWWEEQNKLTQAYEPFGMTSYLTYKQAYDRYWWTGFAYASASVLTTGVFVWMMVELWDYLGAAQDSLP